MIGTPFILGGNERAQLIRLRDEAAKAPVDMPKLMQVIETPDGKAAHMRQMTAQSVILPFGYSVTFSIETGHPIGTCRHLSMSSPAAGRLPIPAAVWMVAEVLGFTGELRGDSQFPPGCTVWIEVLEGHGGDAGYGDAVNVVQPIMPETEGRRQ